MLNPMNEAADKPESQSDPKPSSGSVLEVLITFLKLGMTSFGGPIAHIGFFRRELVEKKGWVSDSHFTQLMALCQFLPGPASSQLGFALGLTRAGWLGAISAFTAFTLPSVCLMITFAWMLPNLTGPISSAAIHGLKLVACAVVLDAIIGMYRNLCPDNERRTIAIIAAVMLILAGSAQAQIFVVLVGAVAGLWLCRGNLTEVNHDLSPGLSKRFGLVMLLLFAAILLGLPILSTFQGGLASVAEAFYRAGALVFGGGHVVLPLLEESVVGSGWVSDDQFLAGYGAAQAIPGPMFAFSAYLGAIIPTEHSSLTTAIVALLFMFLPGFLLVAAGLPAWQWIAEQPRAASAIAGVNAAVVGILIAALYDPIVTSGIQSAIDLAIAAIAFMIIGVWKRSPLWAVLWCLAASVGVSTVL